MKRIIFFASTLFFESSLACSLGAGYELFKFGAPNPKGIEPEAPELVGYQLKRGYDDGNMASCSDAGILELNFARTHGVGYLIEPIDDFELSVFPKDVVQTTQSNNSLRFTWLDWPRQDTDPFDLLVRVTAFYSNGRSSKSTNIRIIPIE